MKLQVAKWGNSLAVCLPMECTRATGLKEDDSVEASITASDTITLSPEKTFDKTAFLTRIAKLQASIPMTELVVEAMRQEKCYITIQPPFILGILLPPPRDRSILATGY